MTAVTKRMAALMRDPGSLATITSDHEGWKIEAKERWLEMTGVDQRRVTKALEPFLVALETATERATKGKPKHKATETYDPDTGEIPGEVGEAA
jgi:hypothetical protein